MASTPRVTGHESVRRAQQPSDVPRPTADERKDLSTQLRAINTAVGKGTPLTAEQHASLKRAHEIVQKYPEHSFAKMLSPTLTRIATSRAKKRANTEAQEGMQKNLQRMHAAVEQSKQIPQQLEVLEARRDKLQLRSTQQNPTIRRTPPEQAAVAFNPRSLIQDLPWYKRIPATWQFKKYEKAVSAAERSKTKISSSDDAAQRARAREKLAPRYEAASQALTAWGAKWTAGNQGIATLAAQWTQQSNDFTAKREVSRAQAQALFGNKHVEPNEDSLALELDNVLAGRASPTRSLSSEDQALLDELDRMIMPEDSSA